MSENNLQNRNFRLQILSHEEIFSTRDSAITYITKNFKPFALKSEPAVVYYASDNDEPNMILAVGSGDGNAFIIDFAAVTEQISKLDKDETADREKLELTETAIEEIMISCGLSKDDNKIKGKISYRPNSKFFEGQDAETIAKAIDILADFAQNNALDVSETDSVKLSYEDNKPTGNLLKAEVKISANGEDDEKDFNDNIIGIKSDGIYAAAHLEYNEDTNELTFTTSGKNKNGRFQDDAFSQKINLGKHSEIEAVNSDSNPVKITVDNTNTTKTISGNIKLSESPDNIITVENGALYADGKASNIEFNDTTVANVLTELQKKSVLNPIESDTVKLTIGKNASDNTIISADVKRSDNDSLIVTNGGLSVNMKFEIENDNKLILTLGKQKHEVLLPKLKLDGIVTNVYYDKDQQTLTIRFNNGETATIDIKNMLSPYTFKSDDSSPVILTEEVNTEKGTSTIKADIKLLSSVDNLIGIDNGHLFVSEKNIDNKIKVVSDKLNSDNIVLNNKIDNTKTELLENIDETKNEISAEIASVKSVNSEQEGKINSINNNLSEMGAHISSMVEDITELESNVVSNTSDINTLKTDNEVTKADITKLKQNVSDNKTAISNEVNRAQDEEKKINDLLLTNQSAITSEIARATTAEQSLNERVSSNETAISTLNGASTVDGSVRKMISLAIESESNRAIDKETELKSAIDELSKNVIINNTNTLNEAKAYTDNEIGKVNTSIQSTKTEILTSSANDATVKANKSLSDSKAYTDEKFSLEKTRAESKETELDGKISALQTANATINEKLGKKIESVTIEKNSSTDLQYFLKVNDVVKGEINIPKDQFLEDVTYDKESHTLVFTFIIDDKAHNDRKTVNIPIDNLIDTYNAGNGISLNGNVFSVKIAVGSEEYLMLTEDGIMLKGVDAALAELANNKANSSDVYTKADIDAKGYLTEHQDISNLATKEELNTLSENVTVNKDALDIITGNKAQEGSIANAIEVAKDYSKSYTDSQIGDVKKSININSESISILNGNSEDEGSVKKIVKDAVANESNERKSEDTKITLSIENLAKIVGNKANSSDVYTKADIDAKGYLTEHQDINLAYNKATNTITLITNNGEQSFELSDHSLVSEGHYESTTKEIVLTIDKEGGSEQIRIPVGDLLNEWGVDKQANSSVILSKDTNPDGIDILSARVRISDESDNLITDTDKGLYVSIPVSTQEDNLIHKEDEKGTLYASNRADDLTASWNDEQRISVQEAIGKLKSKTDRVDGIDDRITVINGEVEGIKADVSNAKNRIDALENKSGDITINVGDIREQIKLLADRIKKIEENIGTYEKVNSISTRLDEMEKKLNELIDFGVYNA